MGHRDNDELNLSDADMAADEASTRQLLARWGEPAPAPPPPALNARVMAAIAGRPARPAARRPGLAILPALALALLGALVTFGLWGVLGNSLGPASLAGDPSGGLGQLVLGLTLAAKPLVNLLLAAGPSALVAALALVAGAALWWRLVRAPRPAMEAS